MHLVRKARPRRSHLCQCLTIASVESTIVPSISKRIPAKLWISGRPVKLGFSSSRGISIVLWTSLFNGLMGGCRAWESELRGQVHVYSGKSSLGSASTALIIQVEFCVETLVDYPGSNLPSLGRLLPDMLSRDALQAVGLRRKRLATGVRSLQ